MKFVSSGSGLFLGLLLAGLVFSACNDGHSKEPSVLASPKPLEQRFEEKAAAAAAAEASPEPSESVSPESTSDLTEVTDAPPVLLSDKEVKDLRKQFRKKLAQEDDQLRSEQRRARRNSVSARKRHRKDWEASERLARRRFFRDNLHGPERRAYIQDFLARRKALVQLLKDEERSEVLEQASKKRALDSEQANRLREFEENLGRKLRPPEHLWNR